MNKRNFIVLALLIVFFLSSCNNTQSSTTTIPSDFTHEVSNTTKPESLIVSGLKEEYGLGSMIDLSDLKVIVTFSDSSKKELTMFDSSITYDSFDTDTLGTHEIVIKYKDFKKTISYNVKLIYLTLDYNGYSLDGEKSTRIVAEKNVVSLANIVPNASQDGYKFVGWFYDKKLTKRVNFTIENELTISDDTTIYAGYDVDYTKDFQYEIIDGEAVLKKFIKVDYEDCNTIFIPKTVDLYPVTKIDDNFAYEEEDIWGGFSKYYNITAIEFDKDSTVKFIGKRAFQNLFIDNVDLPDTIEKIDDFAFYCTLISKLKLPKNIKSIESYSFAFCYRLFSVDFNDSDLISIGNYAFSDCRLLNQVNLSNKVEMIGANAFQNCSKFTEFYLPASVETIGLNVFSGFPNLVEIKVDENNQKFKSIDGNLYSKNGTIFYRYCYGKKETEFEMPSTVKILFDGAFNVVNEIIYLESIKLNEGLTEIGDLVFENTSIGFVIPSTVTSIGQKAFYGWSGEEFKVSKENKKYISLDGSLVCHQTINGIENCVLYAIPEGYSKESYVLNKSIKIIDSYVCKNLKVSSIIIPLDSELVEIRDNAFILSSYKNLKYLLIERENPFKISNYSFYNEFVYNSSYKIITSYIDAYTEAWKDIQLEDELDTIANLHLMSLDNYIYTMISNLANGIAASSYDGYLAYKYFSSVLDYQDDYYKLNTAYQNILSLLAFSDDLSIDDLNYIKSFTIAIINSSVKLFSELPDKSLIVSSNDFGKFYDYYKRTPSFIIDSISDEAKNIIEKKNKAYISINENNSEIIEELLNYEFSTKGFDVEKYNTLKEKINDNNFDYIVFTDNVSKAYYTLELQNLLYLFSTIEYNYDNFNYLYTIYNGDYGSVDYFIGIEFYLNVYITDEEASKLYGYDTLYDNVAKLNELEADLSKYVNEIYKEEEPENFELSFYETKFDSFDRLSNTYLLDSDTIMKNRLYKLRYYINSFIEISTNSKTNTLYNTNELTDSVMYNLAFLASYVKSYDINYYDGTEVSEIISNYKSQLKEYSTYVLAVTNYNNKYYEIASIRDVTASDFSISNALKVYDEYSSFISAIGESGYFMAMEVINKIASLKDIVLSISNYDEVFKIIEGEINPIFNSYNHDNGFNEVFYVLNDDEAYNNYYTLAGQL